MGRLWRSLAPLKVIAFSWQLLLDRIPTRANLVRRKVILDLSLAVCALCGGEEESALHLFMRCPFFHRAWYDVFRWLEWQVPLPPDLFSLFDVFCSFGCGSKKKRALNLIWHTVLWLIWDMRNGCIFSAKSLDVELVVYWVKSFSWRWFLSKSNGPRCLCYEWHVVPFMSISRK